MAATKGNKYGKQFGKDYQPVNRRKPDSVTALLREYCSNEENGKTHYQRLVEKLVHAAVYDGNMKAIQIIFDRLDGKVIELVRAEVTSLNPQIVLIHPSEYKKPITDEAEIVEIDE